MKIQPLATLLSTFFLQYLALERGVSPNTSTSYRDALKLFLQFSATRCRRSVDQLVIEDLNATMVLDFLTHLETSRANTVRTRNARLAAIQTFFRYVAGREPSLATLCGPILAIPAKKALRPVLGYLSEQELVHLLAQVDRTVSGTENVITCSSACSTTLAPVFRNFSICGLATSTWIRRHSSACVAKEGVNG